MYDPNRLQVAPLIRSEQLRYPGLSVRQLMRQSPILSAAKREHERVAAEIKKLREEIERHEAEIRDLMHGWSAKMDRWLEQSQSESAGRVAQRWLATQDQ